MSESLGGIRLLIRHIPPLHPVRCRDEAEARIQATAQELNRREAEGERKFNLLMRHRQQPSH